MSRTLAYSSLPQSRHLALLFAYLRSLLGSVTSAPPFLLLLSCCIILAPYILLPFLALLFCLSALSSLLIQLSSFPSFASFFLLHRSRSLCPALSLSPYVSRSFSFAFLSRIFPFPSLYPFLFSAVSLHFSHLLAFRLFFSFTMPCLLAECSAVYCVSVDKPSPTRSCKVCDRHALDRCDTDSRLAPIEATDLSLWESHHLACSRTH